MSPRTKVVLLAVIGLLFQIPVGMLAVTRLGIVTPKQLRQWRGYAYVVIAVLAALLPTVDPVTMVIEMVPLVVLYELSIVLASLLGTPGKSRAPAEPSAEGSG